MISNYRDYNPHIQTNISNNIEFTTQNVVDSTMDCIFSLVQESYKGGKSSHDLELLKKCVKEFSDKKTNVNDLCNKVKQITGLSFKKSSLLVKNNMGILNEILMSPPLLARDSAPIQQGAGEIISDKISEINSPSELIVIEMEKPSFDIHNRNWEAVTTVTTSREGLGGVWFYQDETGKKLVVKRDAMHQQQAFATQFLKEAGFRSPEMTLVPRNSEEGAKIIALSEKHAKNPLTNPKSRPALSAGDGAFCVMSLVKGSSATNIVPHASKRDVGSFKSVVNTPEFAQELGKMVIFDRLINNVDRFKKDSLNEGNIMIDEQGLVPVDQTSSVSVEMNHFSELSVMVDQLYSENTKLKYAGKISDQFFAKTQVRLQPMEIALGMKQAVDDITQRADHYIEILPVIDANVSTACQKESKMQIVNPRFEMDTLQFIQKGIKTIKQTRESKS